MQTAVKIAVHLAIFVAVLIAWLMVPEPSQNLVMAGLFVLAGLAPALLDRAIEQIGVFMLLLAGWMLWQHVQLNGDAAAPQAWVLVLVIGAALVVSAIARGRAAMVGE